MNKNKDGSGNRTLAIIVFLILTLSVPFVIYFINIILTAITGFLNTHLPSALRTVLAFLIDGESIADEILNPLITALFLYFLVDVVEKICPSREGLRYLCGILLSAAMLIIEIRYFLRTSTDDSTASIAMTVMISQGIYTIMLARLFHSKGTLSMLLRRKNMVVFMAGDDLSAIKGYAVVKCARPIVNSKGEVDWRTLDKMFDAVWKSSEEFYKSKYKFAFPCRREGINAIYNCYIEFEKASQWDFDHSIRNLRYPQNGKAGSFPLDIVNTLKQVKTEK